MILQPGKLYALTAAHKKLHGPTWKHGCWSGHNKNGGPVQVHMDTVLMFESMAPDKNKHEPVAWFLIGDQLVSSSLEQKEIEGVLKRVGK